MLPVYAPSVPRNAPRSYSRQHTIRRSEVVSAGQSTFPALQPEYSHLLSIPAKCLRVDADEEVRSPAPKFVAGTEFESGHVGQTVKQVPIERDPIIHCITVGLI